MSESTIHFYDKDVRNLEEKLRLQIERGTEIASRLIYGCKELKNEKNLGIKHNAIKEDLELKKQNMNKALQQKRECFDKSKQLAEVNIKNMENIRIEAVKRIQLLKHFLYMYEIELGFRLRPGKELFDFKQDNKEIIFTLYDDEDKNVFRTLLIEYKTHTNEFSLIHWSGCTIEKPIQTDLRGFVKALLSERMNLLNSDSVKCKEMSNK